MKFRHILENESFGSLVPFYHRWPKTFRDLWEILRNFPPGLFYYICLLTRNVCKHRILQFSDYISGSKNVCWLTMKVKLCRYLYSVGLIFMPGSFSHRNNRPWGTPPGNPNDEAFAALLSGNMELSLGLGLVGEWPGVITQYDQMSTTNKRYTCTFLDVLPEILWHPCVSDCHGRWSWS